MTRFSNSTAGKVITQRLFSHLQRAARHDHHKAANVLAGLNTAFAHGLAMLRPRLAKCKVLAPLPAATKGVAQSGGSPRRNAETFSANARHTVATRYALLRPTPVPIENNAILKEYL
jgi:hypothetical protein